MEATTKITTDHQHIRDWANSRNGQPAVKDGKPFISFSAGDGEPIFWEDFFKRLEGDNLAFMYRDEVDPDDKSKLSVFNEMVDRSMAEEMHKNENGESKK